MGIPVLILGESGSGKSASLRNFEAKDVGVFNVASKPLVGKRFGVVLAEEEYIKSNGARATRLYVAQTRSLRAIKDGDYTVPDKKLLPSDQRDTHRATDPVTVSATGFDEGGFAEVEDDGELPF